MHISKQALLSLSLLAVSTGLWIPWALNVNVTNLPLDEHGNLKVSSVTSKVITVEKELNFSYPDYPHGAFFTTDSIQVDGFREFHVYVDVASPSSDGTFSYYVDSQTDGIETLIQRESGETYFNFGSPHGNSRVAGYNVCGTSITISCVITAENVGGWLLLSISLYLRN